MVDGGFMKFTIRVVSWYWTMFDFPSSIKLELLVVSHPSFPSPISLSPIMQFLIAHEKVCHDIRGMSESLLIISDRQQTAAIFIVHPLIKLSL
jgi:hypothetical protein